MIPLETPIKSTVVRINAAQAFMLITEHKGNTNLEIVGRICKFSSATSIVRGNVAAEDLEKNDCNQRARHTLKRLYRREALCFEKKGKDN